NPVSGLIFILTRRFLFSYFLLDTPDATLRQAAGTAIT
ncbi:unnamed protein product, partial [marine sediment metagenome]